MQSDAFGEELDEYITCNDISKIIKTVSRYGLSYQDEVCLLIWFNISFCIVAVSGKADILEALLKINRRGDQCDVNIACNVCCVLYLSLVN